MERSKDLVPKMQVDRYKIHDIEVVIDRLKVEEEFRVRISQSVQQAVKMGKDLLFVSLFDEQHSQKNSRQRSFLFKIADVRRYRYIVRRTLA